MAFALSPGVTVVEKDFSSIIPAVSTSTGAFAGSFAWGPVLAPTLISSENELVQRFSRPNDSNAQSWWTAANFLSYTGALYVVRVDSNGQRNAVADTSGVNGSLVSATVATPGTGFTDIPTVSVTGGTGSGGTATATLKAVAVAVNAGGSGFAVNDTFTVNIGSGTEATFRVTSVTSTVSPAVTGIVNGVQIVSAGNYSNISAGLSGVAVDVTSGSGTGLTVDIALGLNTVAVSGGSYTVAPSLSANNTGGTGSAITNVVIETSGLKINNETDYVTNFINGAAAVGEFAAKYPGTLGNSITVSMADSASYAAWTYKDEFDGAPGTSSQVDGLDGSDDELHVIVIDTLGLWTGVVGGIMEKFAYLSKASDAKKFDGSNNYYKDAINNSSKYIWWMDHPTAGTNWGTAAGAVSYATLSTAITRNLTGGADDFVYQNSDYIEGFDMFLDAEQYDISLILTGHVTPLVAKHVIQNVIEGGSNEYPNGRRDCVAFISPYDWTNGVPFADAQEVVTWRNDSSFNVNSSYAVMDSGYKYQYDRYNDKYRWIPLNGDIAGLCARTDFTNDPWFSPGGFNRGQVKSVIKLSLNANKTQRDLLYKNGVNPVVSFPGQGVVLFGDKTLQAKPSAFDRINVRRLFIVLEKAVSTAAKYQLFEFNDDFTRAMFKNMVEPFLRNVQGRRGIIDFRVKCDDTNNTGEVIDRNEFVADIFIKPNRSINFITLNFIAARTSVNFQEIGG